MSDVSAQMVAAVTKTIGLPPSEGAVTGPAAEADRRKRIPWNEVVQLFERAEATLGRDEVLRRFAVHHERFPEAFALARAVVTPAQFARFYFFVASGATPCLVTVHGDVR